MKAAVLESFGSPLSVRTVADPVLGTGEIIVDVVAAGVLPYAKEVFSGERKYLLKTPVVPGTGAIGRIRATGPDATRLQKGDWVSCDAVVKSRDNAITPDTILQGLTARGEGGIRLQDYFHDGSFAEQIRVPTENAYPIAQINREQAGRWCVLHQLLVPYGGLHAINLQAGETLLVSGATGNFGSSGVAVALAMGAGCVIAPGRNEQMLNELARRYGHRVRTVQLTGDEKEDRDRMMRAAPGPIDCVLDLLPPSAPASAVRTAMMTVREFGRIVLMGGVGMLGNDDLRVPYPWIMRNCVTIRGQWMYPRDAKTRLIALVQSGQLNLADFEITAFSLDDVNNAVDHAAAHGEPFKMTVIQP